MNDGDDGDGIYYQCEFMEYSFINLLQTSFIVCCTDYTLHEHVKLIKIDIAFK